MCRTLSLFILFCCSSSIASATVINQSLYINSGDFQPYGINSVTAVCFNSSTTFQGDNVFLDIQTGDTVIFTVYNNDTLVHGFAIKGMSIGGPYVINPASSATVQVIFSSYGLFLYYDSYNYPYYKSLGCSGMIYVHNDNHSTFHWNFFEFDSVRTVHTLNGQWDNLSLYHPRYFTINGFSYPLTENDPYGKVTGSVGDTLIICMGNSGLAYHSIHFHGYHSKILYSSVTLYTGRIKDTFPLPPMEVMILQMIPDKPGQYPVHDHNLVAVTGNGIYKNGMYQIIEIDP